MCGEKSISISVTTSCKGSPPHVRGKAEPEGLRQLSGGIIPAYAGKRGIRYRMRFRTRDHPRVCGEKRSAFPVLPCGWGSPPRMRGKVLATIGHNLNTGITPARAGKSVSRRPRWTHTGDHPRVCGEKLFQSPLLRLLLGSPPRVRGKGNDVGCLRQVHGITPAHAGKSAVKRSSASLSKDHPRACGEKRRQTVKRVLVKGSPPRMRGKGTK